jgi:anti-sigma-K factor RskA
MDYERPPRLEALAARYATGTLRGRARARFERACRQSPVVLAAVRRWEMRLARIAAALEPLPVPAEVHTELRARICALRELRAKIRLQ